MLHVISVSLLLDPPSKFPLKSPPPLSLPQHPHPSPPPPLSWSPQKVAWIPEKFPWAAALNMFWCIALGAVMLSWWQDVNLGDEDVTHTRQSPLSTKMWCGWCKIIFKMCVAWCCLRDTTSQKMCRCCANEMCWKVTFSVTFLTGGRTRLYWPTWWQDYHWGLFGPSGMSLD